MRKSKKWFSTRLKLFDWFERFWIKIISAASIALNCFSSQLFSLAYCCKRKFWLCIKKSRFVKGSTKCCFWLDSMQKIKYYSSNCTAMVSRVSFFTSFSIGLQCSLGESVSREGSLYFLANYEWGCVIFLWFIMTGGATIWG